MSLKFTNKNFKQPNCFSLSMHAYCILLPSETDDSRFNRVKSICSQTQFSHTVVDLGGCVWGGAHLPGSGQQGCMGGGCKNDVYPNSNQLMLRNSVAYP